MHSDSVMAIRGFNFKLYYLYFVISITQIIIIQFDHRNFDDFDGNLFQEIHSLHIFKNILNFIGINIISHFSCNYQIFQPRWINKILIHLNSKYWPISINYKTRTLISRIMEYLFQKLLSRSVLEIIKQNYLSQLFQWSLFYFFIVLLWIFYLCAHTILLFR